MKGKTLLVMVVLLFSASHTFCNAEPSLLDSLKRKWFIGSSGFILVNLLPNQENPPGFFQLNCGYWLTDRDVFAFEAITWKYNAPLGIPYGPYFENPNESYPGYIRDFGIGVVYQRFLWKGLYAAAHVLPLVQTYVETTNQNRQNGFMLFLTIRTGYHIKLLEDRFFFEPSIACTYWPVKTNSPSSFTSIEEKWPNYFLFEPGLHLGIMF